MLLKNRHTKGGYRVLHEYYCELTEALDLLARLGLESQFRHYIVADAASVKDGMLAIRVPGGTVGTIILAENGVIAEISITQDYVIKTYPPNVNDLLKKFIGEHIEYEN